MDSLRKIRQTMTSKQCLGITLNKEVKDCYNENYKILNREVAEDTRRLKDLLYSWIGRISIMKMTI
jgi:hypothetical protein